MLGCYSSTVVRQQKRRDCRNRSSIFGLLDRPSPQIADVLPLLMSTPQRSMILGSPAQHHEETCRWAKQVYSRYCAAPKASVEDHDGSNVVTWSYFWWLHLQTNLATEFRTDCSRSSRHFGAPPVCYCSDQPECWRSRQPLFLLPQTVVIVYSS